MMEAKTMFLRCTHLNGLEVFAWLTNAQAWATGDSWNEDRVFVFEDRAGEMVEHDVLLSDLEVLGEV